MRNRRRSSIRKRLILLIGGISIGSLLLGFGAVTLRDVAAFRDATVEQAVLVARVVGEYTVPDLAFADRSAAEDSLRKLALVGDMEHAALYDVEGRLFSAWGTDDAAEEIDPAAAAEVEWVERGLRVVEPVVWEGERYGTLVLMASTRGTEEKVAAHLATLGLLLLALTALALVAASRWERIISRPILDLARTVRRITLTGDWSTRVKTERQDEIGTLAGGIDEMLEQIHRREAERDAAEHRTREKSQFLANMSHELRTPLNSIIGFSDILLGRCQGRLDARELRFLGNIRTSGKHLLAIINDILDLSKVEAGRMELLPEQVILDDVIRGTLKLMNPMADEAGVALVAEPTGAIPPFRADPVKLKQILYNLVSNAVKFSPQGSEVRISARLLPAADSPLGERSVEIEVADDGIGIAAEHHEAIFRSFQQVDGTSARRFGGTGLGLALVRSFSELHGGTVSVESSEGTGSRFTVLIPARLQAAERPPETGEVRGARILVVEDDPETCAALRGVLGRAGFEVLEAANGDAALALARTARPAAITLDLVLPGMMDGWEVLRHLKAEASTADIPILIFSRLENRELGISLGADDYFLKPVDLQRLVGRLRGLATEGRRSGVRPGRARRILVVDDDPSVPEILAERLEREGYLVEGVGTSAEALERIRHEAPDLVLLDLMMGDLDGFRVAVELRAIPEAAGVPIVLLTGDDLTAEDTRRLQDKILGLVEPDGVEEGHERLVAVLRDLLARRGAPPEALV